MYFIKESPFLNCQQVSMKRAMENQFFVLFFMLEMFLFSSSSVLADNHISAVGDPGMKRDGLRVAFEAWNFCNEVGSEAPQMGSPSAANCFDLSNASLVHKVTEAENRLGKPFPGLSPVTSNNLDLYAAENEQYLGSLCEAEDTPNPWHLWMVMLKNGQVCVPKMEGVAFPTNRKVPIFWKWVHEPAPLVSSTDTVDGWWQDERWVQWNIKASRAKGYLNLQYELSLQVLDYLCSRVLRGPAHLSAFVIYIALIYSFAKDYG